MHPRFNSLILTAALVLFLGGLAGFSAELRIGIIGTDTSHVIAFTELINNPQAKGHVPGGKVVAAFKGGSPDVESSRTRVDQYAQQLKNKYGVVLYETIEEMCRHVDAVLLESVDGRPHLAQLRPVLKARKPVFIDKPVAASLRDAVEIYKLARKARVPIFSSSSLRFSAANIAVRQGAIGAVSYAETSSPCTLEPHHPDLFWYGIHGVEALFTVMGGGCETVQRGQTEDGRIEVIGTWKGGRKGIYRESKTYGGLARGTGGEKAVGAYEGYQPLVVEIMKFFQTGIAPVSPEETLEIVAFMEAADASKRLGGKAVRLAKIK